MYFPAFLHKSAIVENIVFFISAIVNRFLGRTNINIVKLFFWKSNIMIYVVPCGTLFSKISAVPFKFLSFIL